MCSVNKRYEIKTLAEVSTEFQHKNTTQWERELHENKSRGRELSTKLFELIGP